MSSGIGTRKIFNGSSNNINSYLMSRKAANANEAILIASGRGGVSTSDKQGSGIFLPPYTILNGDNKIRLDNNGKQIFDGSASGSVGSGVPYVIEDPYSLQNRSGETHGPEGGRRTGSGNAILSQFSSGNGGELLGKIVISTSELDRRVN